VSALGGVAAAATVPGPPTNVTATAGAGQATVSWSPPADNGGAPVNGYVVTPFVGYFPLPSTIFNSAATTETVTGLTNGTTYRFKVAAVNSSPIAFGTGQGSPSRVSNPVTPLALPDAPVIGIATGGEGQATVSWTAPADGGSPILGYVVTPVVAAVAQPSTTFNSTETTQTMTGLTDDTSYRFRVQALSAIGSGGQSGASNTVVPSSASPSEFVPDAPTIGSATFSNTQATVTWTEPSSDGGSPITGYEVTPYVATVAQPSIVFDDTGTTQTINGLTNGTSYEFAVSAINSVGFSAPSAFSNAVIPATVPDPPTIGLANWESSAAATVRWTPGSSGGAPITGYVVTPYIAGVAQTPVAFNSAATTETVHGLTNGTTYTFTVHAVNDLGTSTESAQSNAVTPMTVPSAPPTVTATAGNMSATVSWTVPASDGGSPIIGYIVTAYLGHGSLGETRFSSTATTQIITPLTNGTTYSFTVEAFNAIGRGDTSIGSNGVTPGPSVPDAPTIGTASGGNAQAALTWTAPAFNGNSTVTGYVVTPYIASVAQTPVTFNSTATVQTITGLTNGTTYTFTVAAINAVGTGAQSTESNAVTPATVPGAPTIGTASAGSGQATVSWTAPTSDGGSPITGYVVTPYVGYAPQPSTTFNSTATTQIVTGLTNGTSYRFRVQAINAAGTGGFSKVTNQVTPS
jgi:titin